jgi:hypothetical protein
VTRPIGGFREELNPPYKSSHLLSARRSAVVRSCRARAKAHEPQQAIPKNHGVIGGACHAQLSAWARDGGIATPVFQSSATI